MRTTSRTTGLTALSAACLLGVSLLAPPAPADASTALGLGRSVAASSDPAVPPPTGSTRADSVVTTVTARSRLAVGDSIMVGASPLLRRHGFAIHAKVGRQFSTAPGIVRSYGTRLPRNVIIELGTNGTVSLAACRAVVRTAGPNRRVFLVTNRVPRSWQDSNNRTLRACDRSFAASRVRIIDWHRASAGHPEWFARDRVHPSAAGRRAFASLIVTAVRQHGL
jgi:hypothetical protein